MRIVNFSDVITNSSSEVFTLYTEDGIDNIKNIINGILEAGGSSCKCDDLFEINYDYDFDELEKRFFDYYNRESTSKDELIKFFWTHDDTEGSYPIYGLYVEPKDPKNERVANLVSLIGELWDHDIYYT